MKGSVHSRCVAVLGAVIASLVVACGSWETRLLLHNAGFAHRVIVRWGEKVAVASGGNAYATVMSAVDKGATAVTATSRARASATRPTFWNADCGANQ